MFEDIAFAEAIGATGLCIIAIHKWVSWRNAATELTAECEELESECDQHISRITDLCRQMDAAKTKPGPAQRKRDRQQFEILKAQRCAELLGLVPAK